MAFQVVLLIATEIAGFFYQQSYEEQLMDAEAYSSVIRQKVESQSRGKKKTKHVKFSEKNEHELIARNKIT